ncbi:MAG: AraC family transcriptional regulator [Tyzzerella sp.]|nr:AraC family transcriptional regulator [Tyzzerella sp.]
MLSVRNEKEINEAACFVVEQYVCKGYSLHFHKNLEIFGVVKGKVAVTIAGQRMVLHDGQIAIIDKFENHSYEIDGEAEVVCAYLGTRYLRDFYSLYPEKRLPLWLEDTDYNEIVFRGIEKAMNVSEENTSELDKIAAVYQLLSCIVERYEMVDKKDKVASDNEFTTEVVQYIYDHYNENITLETLSKVFYVSPKALGIKIGKRLNVDLRVFVNDIRVQRAVQMMDDSKNKDKTLEEIAMMCGFNSMRTFYRSYERNFGFRKLPGEEKSQK